MSPAARRTARTTDPAVVRVTDATPWPLELATETFGILARKGSGKTYLGMKFTEQLLDNGVPVVVIDPLGVWWGLKSDTAGTGPGFPIAVFGGDHADLDLAATDGKVIAELVADQRPSAVLDLSHLSKSAGRRFVADFLERLFEINRQVCHLVVDECDLVAPQRLSPETARLLGAMEDVVRRGRVKGLGVTLISQRPASVNKDVLTQVSVLVALRMTGKQDVDAIDAWVRLHADGNEAAAMKASLGSLETGHGWVWSTVPGFSVLEQVRVLSRSTFDSSATPKVGQAVARPTVTAALDVPGLRAALEMARAKTSTPAAGAAEPTPRGARGARPRGEQHDLAQLQEQVVSLTTALDAARAALAQRNTDRDLELERLRAALQTIGQVVSDATGSAPPSRSKGPSGSSSRRPDDVGPAELPTTMRRKPTPSVPPADAAPAAAAHAAPTGSRAAGPAASGDVTLGRAERRILAVLARDGERDTRQIALLTGYSTKGGGFRNALSRLRTAGYVTGHGRLQITLEGRAAAGEVEVLPTGADLLRWWQGQLHKAEREVLGALAARYPHPMTVQEIADATGYSAVGGGFRNALSKLRTLGLIDGRGDVRLDPTLTST